MDLKNIKELTLKDKLIAYNFAIIGAVALLIVRVALFDYDWGDYSYFYQHWVAEFRTMSFIEGLRAEVGNYNPPHMYIFNIIARINVYDLYLIKIVSVFFDFLIAFFVMKIVSLKTESLNMHILAFLLTLAIPTVVLNSSMWAQCDAVYVAFAIGAFYFALSGRSRLAYAFIAIAFAFKMQSVFIMPVFPILVLMKKIRLRDCYIFPAVYLAMLLPAVLAGKSIGDIFLTYIKQVDTFSSLNMNLVNVWQLVGHVDYESFRTAGLFIAGLAVLGLMYFTYVHRERLTSNTDYVRLAFLFTLMMPFLLPKMHDRYYMLADVMSVVVFLFDKRRWYVPVITIFCSYIAYAWFLMSAVVLFDYKIAALALLAVLLVVLRDYVLSLRGDLRDR